MYHAVTQHHPQQHCITAIQGVDRIETAIQQNSQNSKIEFLGHRGSIQPKSLLKIVENTASFSAQLRGGRLLPFVSASSNQPAPAYHHSMMFLYVRVQS